MPLPRLPAAERTRLCRRGAGAVSRCPHHSLDAERRLWSALRDRRLDGYRFRRQCPIGPFIADFACTRERLIVEADGGQHSDSNTDDRRTAWLQNRGWRVLRFWNNEILRNPG